MNIKWNSIIIILITVIGVKFIIDYEGTSAINIDDLNIDVCINDCYEDNEDIISELNRIIALVEEEIEKTSTDENVCIGELNSGITSITKDCIIEHPENGNMGPAVLRSILEKMNYVVSELLTCNEFENCEQKLESINLNYKINVSQNKAEIIEKYHNIQIYRIDVTNGVKVKMIRGMDYKDTSVFINEEVIYSTYSNGISTTITFSYNDDIGYGNFDSIICDTCQESFTYNVQNYFSGDYLNISNQISGQNNSYNTYYVYDTNKHLSFSGAEDENGDLEYVGVNFLDKNNNEELRITKFTDSDRVSLTIPAAELNNWDTCVIDDFEIFYYLECETNTDFTLNHVRYNLFRNSVLYLNYEPSLGHNYEEMRRELSDTYGYNLSQLDFDEYDQFIADYEQHKNHYFGNDIDGLSSEILEFMINLFEVEEYLN